jgi:hypothetical protein
MVAGPTVPPPPALLSMTMGWPMNFDALSAIARIEMSVDPPAGHGTISVIGLVGYSCASAGLAKIAAAAIAMIKPLPCNIEFLSRMRPAVGRGARCLLFAARDAQ